MCRVDCGPLDEKTPVLFESAQDLTWAADLELSEQLLSLPRGLPRKVNIKVHNATRHDIILGRCTPLGSLQLVQSVTPLEVRRKDLPDSGSVTSTEEDNIVLSEGQSQLTSEEPHGKIPSSRTPVELGKLTKEQQQLAIRMLQEEAESFAKEDEDVGCINRLQMSLLLSDPTPVEKTYASIPRPLYTEVKHYIEDLLHQGWITKSQSLYASPVICVREKLNRKTVQTVTKSQGFKALLKRVADI